MKKSASFVAPPPLFQELSPAPDPWDVLGLPHDATLSQARAVWKSAVRDSHPDRMIARGIPPEALKLAERRLIAVNEAWRAIEARLDA